MHGPLYLALTLLTFDEKRGFNHKPQKVNSSHLTLRVFCSVKVVCLSAYVCVCVGVKVSLTVLAVNYTLGCLAANSPHWRAIPHRRWRATRAWLGRRKGEVRLYPVAEGAKQIVLLT